MQAIVNKESCIKIGHTVDHPKRRLIQVQMCCPIPVRLVFFAKIEGVKGCYKKVENRLHETYEHERIHGEWFKVDVPDYEILRVMAVDPLDRLLCYATTEIWRTVHGKDNLLWSKTLDKIIIDINIKRLTDNPLKMLK